MEETFDVSFLLRRPFPLFPFSRRFSWNRDKSSTQKKDWEKEGRGKRGEIDLCVCVHERNAHDAASDEWSTWHFLPTSAVVPKLRSIINRSNREKCGPKHAAQFGENMARIPTFETQFFSSPFFP